MYVKRFLVTVILLLGTSFLVPREAAGFCGFYVGKADAKLFNKASQVVIARHENRTVISMQNDYEGELSEFALVVPVPVVLEEGQIHVGDRAIFERIDAFTAPRLVEYHDPDPCVVRRFEERAALDAAPASKSAGRRSEPALGVTVEAAYTIGEYDIVILSATQSDGLETWLRENGYRIPNGARRALAPYIRQNLKFFVARVNLEKQARTGLTMLRPLQFAFEDERFMLPIRLGMLNARGPQDLVVYALTRGGRVETTNYPTTRVPTDVDLPLFVKDEFARFYRALFDHQVERNGMRTVFTEYFWDMGWCDPCASDPLSREELRSLGVFWLDEALPAWNLRGRGIPVKVTRLHVRYSAKTFPEDLFFQETGDRRNYQARYVLRHPWRGPADRCNESAAYFRSVRERQERAARQLANLTGWDLADIRERIDFVDARRPEPKRWWQQLWPSGESS